MDIKKIENIILFDKLNSKKFSALKENWEKSDKKLLLYSTYQYYFEDTDYAYLVYLGIENEQHYFAYLTRTKDLTGYVGTSHILVPENKMEILKTFNNYLLISPFNSNKKNDKSCILKQVKPSNEVLIKLVNCLSRMYTDKVSLPDNNITTAHLSGLTYYNSTGSFISAVPDCKYDINDLKTRIEFLEKYLKKNE